VPLSPDEIASKEFSEAASGYDKDEVRSFLNAVASAYRDASGSGATEEGGDGAPTSTKTPPTESVPLPPAAEGSERTEG